MSMQPWKPFALLALGLLPFSPSQAQKPVIPHAQDVPPGPALSSKEAIAKMKVPEGFTVEVVAAEPDLINPVAMTFDEKGRIWITESIEYPRLSPGVGKDRIKVFESSKGDGNYDQSWIFAEGLNIPSGIAVGYGGVWVANAPDILFYKLGDDGKAVGKPEVVVTGFGRHDTHELPNSLTWGPDGWLYGLNGVFNYSKIQQHGKVFDFTVAMFRIHPRTREFQLFCQGTSNPWGIAFNHEGAAFISACVIDHLWHLTESGYYQRQAGAAPPHTWILPSIVKHKHQKAAYCGIQYYDSDAYPEAYRKKFYMGNIHGGCLNCDEVSPDGSTYFGKPKPDFLTANDAWFMPVAQKVGPDGSIYVLDWYDRYHCYQDANRDPAGIDRLRGRLYRIHYNQSPVAKNYDLSKQTDQELLQHLSSGNQFFREMARHVLSQRKSDQLTELLENSALDSKSTPEKKLQCLLVLIAQGDLRREFHLKLLDSDDGSTVAWAIRAAGNQGKVDAAIRAKIIELARSKNANTLLQVAIAAGKLQDFEPIPVWLDILASCGDDKLIPAIVWQNLLPRLESEAPAFLSGLSKADLGKQGFSQFLPRAFDYLLTSKKQPIEQTAALLPKLWANPKTDPALIGRLLGALATRLESGEIGIEQRQTLHQLLESHVTEHTRSEHPYDAEMIVVGTMLGNVNAQHQASLHFNDTKRPEKQRLRMASALVNIRASNFLKSLPTILIDTKNNPSSLRGDILNLLGKWDSPRIAELVLAAYPKLEPELQPRAIETLTQRPEWAKLLLKEIAAKKIPSSALNVTQVRKLLAGKDTDLTKQVTAVWGTLREGRDTGREKIVAQMRQMLKTAKGDPLRGIVVYKTLCGQCHKIHGDGVEVGPDITVNGRSDYEQLLSNVFDPSLVIGAGYHGMTVTTTGGQTITGLVVEDSPQRVVLKLQGGKLETVAAADVESKLLSKLSLMPEGIETQLKPQEIADLFAFLTLDKPPSDPTARRIKGAPSFE